jgi:hypothetical protein
MTLGLFPLSAAVLAACGSSTPTAVNPMPTPTPNAVATPKPAVVLAGCGLTAMPDLHTECPHTAPEYGPAVDDAIKKAFDEHPELFDTSQTKGGGIYSYKVLDHRKYTTTVVANLQAAGYCAADQLEEIQVKKSQDFNEQYNIWTSDGYVRLPPGAYITTCTPAQF